MLGKLRKRYQIPETGYDTESRPLVAFLNEGMWIVQCPDCRGAEAAFDECWFFCCSCKNAVTGHKYRRFVFPPHRKQIEELLDLRPLPNRNWLPGETLDDIKRDNEEHVSELLNVGGD